MALLPGGRRDDERRSITITLILDGHGLIEAQRAADEATGFDRLTVGHGRTVSHRLAFTGRGTAGDVVVIAGVLQHGLIVIEHDDT